VIAEVCKPLFRHVFQRFEPARSNSVKQFSVKGLTRGARKYKRVLEKAPIRSDSAAISTAGGRG
jgi:hypothetical protein